MTIANFWEFVRFCLVGSISALLSIILLFILTDILSLHYLLSFIIGFVVINALAYAASRSYTFRHSESKITKGALRYYAVSLFGLALNTVAMYVLVSLLGLPYLAAAVLLIVLNAPLNYALHKRFTFGSANFAMKCPKAAK